MKPGGKLDALIAEKVMGFSKEKALRLRSLHDDVSFESLGSGYRYSTDIAAAWEVVEKLGLAIGRNDVYPELGKWVCLPNMSDGEGWLFGKGGIYADTAPHAICLAALKAVGYEP